MAAMRDKLSLGQRWSEARPTKTRLFWSCVASAVLAMGVGFECGWLSDRWHAHDRAGRC